MLQRVLFRRPGLVALAGLALILSSAPRVQAAEEDPVLFRLRVVVYNLRNAKEYARNLTGADANAKEKILGAVDDAITQMKQCAKDAGYELPYDPPKKPGDDPDNSYLRAALRDLRDAKDDLRSLKGVSGDHREAAFAAMDKAGEKIKDALGK